VKDAIKSFSACIALNKAFRECHLKIAAAYRDLENFNKVERHLRYAIKLDPKDPRAYSYLGDILNNQKKFSSALELYLSGIALSPKDQNLHISAADALSNMKRAWEAFKMYEKARKLRSRSPEDTAAVLVGYVFSSNEVAYWKNSERDIVAMLRDTSKMLKKGLPSPISPYRMLFVPANNELRYSISYSWSHRYVTEELAIYGAENPHKNKNTKLSAKDHMNPHIFNTFTSSYEPITVGYLSRRFEDYPGTHLLLRIFSYHNRSRVTVHSFANGPDDGSKYRKFIIDESDNFTSVFHLSPYAGAQEISSQDIQILVDYGNDNSYHFNNMIVTIESLQYL